MNLYNKSIKLKLLFSDDCRILLEASTTTEESFLQDFPEY